MGPVYCTLYYSVLIVNQKWLQIPEVNFKKYSTSPSIIINILIILIFIIDIVHEVHSVDNRVKNEKNERRYAGKRLKT